MKSKLKVVKRKLTAAQLVEEIDEAMKDPEFRELVMNISKSFD